MLAMRAYIVTLTRGVHPLTRISRDVNHRHVLGAAYMSTSSSPLISVPKTRFMTAKERTNQIQTQLRRSYHEMSNNADLQLGEVFNVKDKVALVTGGGSGIGLMITQTLAVNGAKVYIVGRTEEKLDRVAEVHGKDIAGQIIPIQGDVASKEGVQ